MFKIMLVLNKKPGMADDAFKDRYENGHVGLVRKLFPNIIGYKRNYVGLENGGLISGEGPLGFDVISELLFASREHFDVALQALADPPTAALLAADEAELFDRATIRVFPVEECASVDLS